MHLHFFPPPPPMIVLPILVTAVVAFVAGGFLLRVTLRAVLALAVGVTLLIRTIVRGLFGPCVAACSRLAFWRGKLRQPNAEPARDLGNSAFDEYRRATLRKLEDEAKEFRAFLAKLRNAADATDFQDFLKSRRADRPQNS